MTNQTDQHETTEDFAATLQVAAPPRRVLDALRTPETVSAWWGPATGSAEAGGTLVVSFQEGRQQIVMHVAQAGQDSRVVWQVDGAPLTPEWAGTTIVFQVSESDGGSVLHFRHHGLTPQLECFDMCFGGWTHYVASLVAYAETGEGSPERHGSAGRGATAA